MPKPQSNLHLFTFEPERVSPDTRSETALSVSKNIPSLSDQEGISLMILIGQFIGFLPNYYAYQWVRDENMCVILPEIAKHRTHCNTTTSHSRNYL